MSEVTLEQLLTLAEIGTSESVDSIMKHLKHDVTINKN